MAASQDRNGGHIIPVFVPFDNNRELSLTFHKTILARRKQGLSAVVLGFGPGIRSLRACRKGFFSATVPLGITLTRATIGHVTIEVTRKHAVLFTLLFAIQMVGLWVTLSRSPVLAGLPRSTWVYFFLMVPGSAFLTTVIIMELLRMVLPQNR